MDNTWMHIDMAGNVVGAGSDPELDDHDTRPVENSVHASEKMF
jgi:hypothetical protein